MGAKFCEDHGWIDPLHSNRSVVRRTIRIEPVCFIGIKPVIKIWKSQFIARMGHFMKENVVLPSRITFRTWICCGPKFLIWFLRSPPNLYQKRKQGRGKCRGCLRINAGGGPCGTTSNFNSRDAPFIGKTYTADTVHSNRRLFYNQTQRHGETGLLTI